MATDIVSSSLAGPPLAQLAVAKPCVGIDVAPVKQTQLTWCWAAVGLCLLNLFRRNSQGLDLCGVARKLLGSNCPAGCNAQGCLETQDVPKVLAVLGLNFAPYVFDAKLPQLLQASDVIVSEISSGTDTHVVVVHHFCESTNEVRMMDPRQDWDTHQGDLQLFLRKEHRSFLVTKAQNPELRAGAIAAPIVKALADAARADLRLAFRSPQEALALERPETASLSIPDKLHESFSRNFSISSSPTAPWLPRLCWSSQDVLVGDLGKTAFLGWRQIFESGGSPRAAVDVVLNDAGRHVFEKASTGKAVKGIADALGVLTTRGIDLAAVSLLAVPCLALHMLQFKDAGGAPKLLTAFSLWGEIQGEMDVATFVAQARAKAVEQRVTNHV
jgi:hypothetical protein